MFLPKICTACLACFIASVSAKGIIPFAAANIAALKKLRMWVIGPKTVLANWEVAFGYKIKFWYIWLAIPSPKKLVLASVKASTVSLIAHFPSRGFTILATWTSPFFTPLAAWLIKASGS